MNEALTPAELLLKLTLVGYSVGALPPSGLPFDDEVLVRNLDFDEAAADELARGGIVCGTGACSCMKF